MDKRSLNVSETAALIGVSHDTVRRLADTGRLPCYRLPSGYRRFDPRNVKEFRLSLERKPDG